MPSGHTGFKLYWKNATREMLIYGDTKTLILH